MIKLGRWWVFYILFSYYVVFFTREDPRFKIHAPVSISLGFIYHLWAYHIGSHLYLFFWNLGVDFWTVSIVIIFQCFLYLPEWGSIYAQNWDKSNNSMDVINCLFLIGVNYYGKLDSGTGNSPMHLICFPVHALFKSRSRVCTPIPRVFFDSSLFFYH